MSAYNQNRRDEHQDGNTGECLSGKDKAMDDNDFSRYSKWYSAEGWGGIISSDAGVIAYELPGHGIAGAAPYWVLPAQSNGEIEVTYAGLSETGSSPYFINNSLPGNIYKFINFPKIIKNIRVLGLMAVISYMIVILFTWMYANFSGYVYFSAGEPMLFIKYPEWALGFVGIFVAIDSLRKELDDGSLW
ncbi:Uncharacterised protein [uncultured archaeon]|nr:Uncharacterised protein [uncultured archaeon]